ncbi:hypothetical protein [Pedobacter endophyticus]|uniref:Uncharacterized protein n=1 Tax=Pedobacter endophyticus TaxID=2789740 RepID=A0A7U3SQA2_9SPHI|nr:hypothetical protein [Pedobacter endophyticus]QPH38901.1 hypothetical protein IZT61_17815 [Pedobacter endophyticus]
MDISEILIEQYKEFCIDTVAIFLDRLDKFEPGSIFEMESHLALFTASLEGLRLCFSQETERILILANHMTVIKIKMLKYSIGLITQRFLQCFILDKGCSAPILI